MTQESGDYTPDKDIKLHSENAIKLICKPFQSHEAGSPEWFKNASDDYARNNIAEDDRVVVLLMQNGRAGGRSNALAVLDFGGMTSSAIDDDFRQWADPEASGDAAGVQGGHGNGGKCYMTQMFEDRSYLHTVKNGLGNVYGTVGGSILLGYFPDRAAGNDFAVPDVKAELDRALGEIDLRVSDLPPAALGALERRQGFTLVVGRGGKGWGSRVPYQQVMAELVEHPQMRMTLEMCSVYAVAGGRLENDGKPLTLPEIPPLPGGETPRVIDIPELLGDPVTGTEFSTTNNGATPPGTLTLKTSDRNMWRGAKKSRHNIVYKAQSGYIGYKPVTDFDVTSTYRDRIYGDCELLSLEPAKMNDRAALAVTPLVRAVEAWIAAEIEKYAKEFEARDRRKHDQEEKDALSQINAALDSWKNHLLDKVLTGDGSGDDHGGGGGGGGAGGLKAGVPARIAIDLSYQRAGVGVAARPHLKMYDATGEQIRPTAVTWTSDNLTVATVDDDIRVLTAHGPGTATLYCETFDKKLRSNSITIEVVDIDTISLEPETVEVPVGSRRRIVATCHLKDGRDLTDVALMWTENDPTVAQVSAAGMVFGFTVGTTGVLASDDRVDADDSVDVTVIPDEGGGDRGSGYPRVLISEIDPDPDTSEDVTLSPDDPPVYQRVHDVERNIWWINSAAPLARLYLAEPFGAESREWRIYHIERYIDGSCRSRCRRVPRPRTLWTSATGPGAGASARPRSRSPLPRA
ncbi:MAG: Ig-like domain-containing protein [Solirubrobacteraceae bacterium]